MQTQLLEQDLDLFGCVMSSASHFVIEPNDPERRSAHPMHSKARWNIRFAKEKLKLFNLQGTDQGEQEAII